MRCSGDDAPLFKRFYDVTPEGNWEGHTILNRLNSPALADAETERELALCRDLLVPGSRAAGAARLGRQGARRLERADDRGDGQCWPCFRAAGLDRDRAHAPSILFEQHMTAPDGRLLHSWRDGRARHPASVDDYANLCRAALSLYEATSDDGLLAQVRDWVAILDRHYWDSAGGGYFFAADDTEALIARAKTAADSAVPAGNGTLVGVLTRLAILTGDDSYRRRAEAIVTTFSGELARNFFPLATLLNNAELLAKPVQIVLVGETGDAAFDALRRAVYGVSLPNRVVLALPPGAELPAGHPAYGKGLVDGQAAAYVCDGPVCSLPLTDPETLLANLAPPH